MQGNFAVKKGHHQKYSSASTLGQEEIAAEIVGKGKWKLFEEEATEHPCPIEVIGVEQPPQYFWSIEEISSPTTEEISRRYSATIAAAFSRRPELIDQPDIIEMVSHNFPQSMETGNDQHQRHNFTQRGVSGICGVPARLSGMVSLAVQTVVLVISCLLVAVLFVHSGGYKYFQKNGTGVASESFLAFGPNDGIENGTNFPHLENIPAPMAILSSTENNETNIEGGGDNSTELLLNLEGMGEGELLNGTTTILDGNNVSSTTIARQIDAAINQENQTLNMDELEMIGNSILEEDEMQSTNSGNETYGINGIIGGNNSTKELKRNQTSSFDGPFEQIHPILLRIGRNAELDLLAMLRALCILYGCACLLWFISLIGLLISLKLEIVDLVYVNTFLLAVVTVLLFINSIAGAVLILYQTEYNWKMLVTICCIESGFVLCLFFNILAITFLIIWYRYIDYMSGGDESCICLSTLVGCIKGRARGGEDGGGGRRQQAEANYTIPEATRHSQLPYIDDPPVQQFSNF